MKFYQRANIYKASNVTFNPETLEAYSYGWWRFVECINGQIVFNDYGYSNSTRKHQYKGRALLHDLGIEIDHVIEAPLGLQNLTSAIALYETRITDLKVTIARPKTKRAKNQERRQTIKFYQNKIKLVKSLIKQQQRQAA